MSDKFNLNFTNDEHDLFLQMKELPNASKLLKDLLRGYLKNPVQQETEEDQMDFSRIGEIIGIFVGEDVVAYGSQEEFNRNVNDEALWNRVQSLRANHPNEADEVIRQVQKIYPKIGARL